MKLRPLVYSLSYWTNHTFTYYRALLSTRSIQLLLVCLAALFMIASAVIAHASVPSSVAKWTLGDAIQKEYTIYPDAIKYYQFIRLEDAEKSIYRFELNMPQSIAEYIENESLFKMEDDLLMALGGEYIKPESIIIWSESENIEAISNIGQFIESSPPKVVVE